MDKEAKYVVRLSDEERGRLEELVARGRVAKATRQRAQVLLRADQGPKGPGGVDEAIVELVGVSLSTVHRVRQQFVEEGLEASLYRKPATNRRYRKLDGVQEAHLVALACSPPPAGRVCWTMQLLADKLVELEIVESIGREAVRTTLKKRRSSALAQRAMGVAARAKRRFCLRDGRRAGNLPASVRPPAAGGVFR